MSIITIRETKIVIIKFSNYGIQLKVSRVSHQELHLRKQSLSTGL